MMISSTDSHGVRLSAAFKRSFILLWAISVLFCLRHYIGYRAICNHIAAYEQEKRNSKTLAWVGESTETPEVSDSFIVVNRAPDDLRREALSFAREHNLAESVAQLYVPSNSQGNQDTEPFMKKNKNKKKRKVVKRRKASSTRASYTESDVMRWQKPRVVDPRFDLPIEKNSFWLSSPFGTRRVPGGGKRFHFGIDMAAVRGTVVKAAGDGEVIQAGYQTGYGNVVVIRHDEKFKTRYAHLSKIVVSAGKSVQKGQKIGNVGSTGNARASGKMRDASHLHFEVEVYGKRVNPFYFLNNA